MSPNRRTVLKAGGLAAALGVTSLAGCSGLLGGSGGGGPETWQYDPSSLLETNNRFFGNLNYAQIYENRESLPESSREDFETDADSPVAASDIEQATGVGGAQVSPETESGAGFGSVAVTGSFDRESITDSIESDGEAEQVGEYEGYTLYEDADAVAEATAPTTTGSATVGVGDGALVLGFASASGTDVDITGEDAVTQMVDASNGNVPLLDDNSEYASQLRDAVDGQSMLVGGEVDAELVETASQESMQSGQFVAGVRAAGFGVNIDGETTTFTFAGIYESAEAAEDTGIKGLVDGFGDQAVSESEGIDSVDAEQEDGVLTVTMTGDTKTLFEGGAAPGTGSSFAIQSPGY